MKNKINLFRVTYPLFIISIMSGCGSSSSSSGSTGSASGTASFFNGATPTSSGSGKSMAHDLSAKRVSLAMTPGDGNWLLSPDKMILTLTSIGFLTSSGSSSGTLTNSTCTITYDRSQVGLTKLVDCPFTVSAGTYTSINVNFNATYQVLINDSTNGFFSTASGITTGSAPAAGAQNYSVTTTSSGSTFGNTSYFASPLTIANGGTVTLNIVVSGLQFFHVNVSSGTVGLGWPSTTYTNDPFRPDMTSSVTSLASLGFYVTPKINTALSYNTSSAGATGITSVSTYYSSASTPTFLVMGLNGTPTNCSPIGVAGVINGPPNHNTLGGYLGLDSNGILGWAVPTDNTWATYSAEFNMTKLTTLNQKTKLYCKQISTDPAPSGNTFASGAPNITSSSDYSTDMVLVAQ